MLLDTGSPSTRDDSLPSLGTVDDKASLRTGREKVRALLIDGDPADAVNILGHAARSRQLVFDVVVCRSVVAAEAELQTAQFDVVYLEYWLGSETSIAFIHALASLRGAPCVVLTHLDEPDIRRVAFRAGAEGFLSKDSLNTQALESVTLAVLRLRMPAAHAAD
jgi:DNA-binding NarL/FixJ family response regulator